MVRNFTNLERNLAAHMHKTHRCPNKAISEIFLKHIFTKFQGTKENENIFF